MLLGLRDKPVAEAV